MAKVSVFFGLCFTILVPGGDEYYNEGIHLLVSALYHTCEASKDFWDFGSKLSWLPKGQVYDADGVAGGVGADVVGGRILGLFFCRV